jgi:hypothetical protein
MENFDVKEIHDIPGIEEYLNEYFYFYHYNLGDDLRLYDLLIDGNLTVVIEMITDTNLVERKNVLHELIGYGDISYLRMTIELDQEVLKSYSYRPYVEEEDKNYYKG